MPLKHADDPGQSCHVHAVINDHAL
jgi:hypothetical protein